MPCHVSYGRKDQRGTLANEHAITALKQLLTLASGSLVLTLTFLKDVAGPASGEAKLIWAVPVGWILLTVCIWLAWVSIAEAAKQINLLGENVYVFAKGRLRLLARIAQWSFFLGLVSITAYSAVNFDRAGTQDPTTNTRCGLEQQGGSRMDGK